MPPSLTTSPAALTGRAALFIIRLALGAIFLWSALAKLRQPYDFLSTVYDYELVTAPLGLAAAMLLPWLELITAFCLLASIALPGALIVAASLSLLFLAVIASALHHGLDIRCGCFGGSDQTRIGYPVLWRAAAMLIAAVAGFVLSTRFPSQTRSTASAAEPPPGKDWHRREPVPATQVT